VHEAVAAAAVEREAAAEAAKAASMAASATPVAVADAASMPARRRRLGSITLARVWSTHFHSTADGADMD
jgi:hypothetical protein